MMQVRPMNEMSKDIDDLRSAVRRLWPKARRYWLVLMWLTLVLGFGWDMKRLLAGNPQEPAGAVFFYGVCIGALAIEYLVARRLRREAAEGEEET